MKKTRKAGGIYNGIYLDYAASTPVAPEVKRAMQPYFSEFFGNPGSLHSFGQEAIAAVDAARETIAKAIRAEFREVIFTSGATEANNLALRGVVSAVWHILRGNGRLSAPAAESGLSSRPDGSDIRVGDQSRRGSEMFRVKHAAPRNLNNNVKPKLIVSAIEHESILNTAYALEAEGVEVAVLPVDKKGIVDLKKLEGMLDERTALLSVMYVNNEIGSVQPLAAIAKLISDFRKESGTSPLFHTDAAQAFEYFECDIKKLGIDLMTLSSQKMYGPKGAGALYIRNKELGIMNYESGKRRDGAITPNSRFVVPEITGGGQEFGLRSGTENVPAIVGFGKALARAEKKRKEHAKYVGALKDYFLKGLRKIYPKVRENGISRAPHIVNLYFPTEFTGDFLVKMDMAGIAVSSGSACSARSFTPSHVLHAIGLPSERVRGSVRFSFGVPTTTREIDEALRRMRNVL